MSNPEQATIERSTVDHIKNNLTELVNHLFFYSNAMEDEKVRRLIKESLQKLEHEVA